MAFKGIVIGRPKSTPPEPVTTKVAPEVLSLVRAFATEYDLYLQEATSYLLAEAYCNQIRRRLDVIWPILGGKGPHQGGYFGSHIGAACVANAAFTSV